jgi:hypothetical protein
MAPGAGRGGKPGGVILECINAGLAVEQVIADLLELDTDQAEFFHALRQMRLDLTFQLLQVVFSEVCYDGLLHEANPSKAADARSRPATAQC